MEIWNVGGIYNSLLIKKLDSVNKKLNSVELKFEIFDFLTKCIWNGGRIEPKSFSPLKYSEFIEKVKFLNSNGIGFNFTFSNLLLEEKHLDDHLGNKLLSLFHSDLNGVIIGSNILAKYIKDKYPKFKLFHSLTHFSTDKDYYFRIKDLYDILILPPIFNSDLDFIKDIGCDKVEILVNETCNLMCPFKKEHYIEISKAHLGLIDKNKIDEVENFCKIHNKINDTWTIEKIKKSIKSSKTSNEQINKLKDIGVSRFKLSGRFLNNSIIPDIYNYILFRNGMDYTAQIDFLFSKEK